MRALGVVVFVAACRWGFDSLATDAIAGDDSSGEQLGSCVTDTDCGRCQRCENQHCERATFVELGLGQYNGCARDERGELWCWGTNTYHAVSPSLPEAAIVARPTRWPLTSVIDELAVGWGTVLMRNVSGGVFSLGSSSGNVNDSQPIWGNVYAGTFAACAIANDTTAWCAGVNDQGQLGRGTQTGGSAQPFAVFDSGRTGLVRMAPGNVTCALDATGALYCVGTNDHGELGRGTTSIYETSVMQVGLAEWAEVAVSEQTACGIKTDGSLWCWGSRYNDAVVQTTPTIVDTASWSHVSAFYRTACALRGGSTLYCAGTDSPVLEPFGNRYSPWKAIPVAIDASTSPVVGGEQACIRQNGAWVCWGNNAYGGVGVDTLTKVGPTPLCQ